MVVFTHVLKLNVILHLCVEEIKPTYKLKQESKAKKKKKRKTLGINNDNNTIGH